MWLEDWRIAKFFLIKTALLKFLSFVRDLLIYDLTRNIFIDTFDHWLVFGSADNLKSILRKSIRLLFFALHRSVERLKFARFLLVLINMSIHSLPVLPLCQV